MATEFSSRQLPGPVRHPFVLRAAVSPVLRKLLWVVFLLFGILLASALYLLGITLLEAATARSLQGYFYLLVYLGHVLLGLALVGPLVLFGLLHWKAARMLPNLRARRIGYALLVTSAVMMLSGLALVKVEGFELRHPFTRQLVWTLHVVAPGAVIWLFWRHRRAGPPMRPGMAGRFAAAVTGLLLTMAILHGLEVYRADKYGGEPIAAPDDDAGPFHPSLLKTATGRPIPPAALMNDQYCLQCHAEVHARWSESAHRFSSFNNPIYKASVTETRRFLLERDGHVLASRLCAGCHDPAPLLSGAFDDPAFEMRNDPSAQAGITCTACHSVTSIDSSRGNADFTIEEARHYPLAMAQNDALAWIGRQLLLARPRMHRETFLKPLHQSAEFCGACHKMRIPEELTGLESVAGKNHYDSFILSGASGRSVRAFSYPPHAHSDCNDCHMPSRSGEADHLFPGANTALPHLRGREDIVREHQAFLRAAAEVDIFGVREGATITGTQHAPLRPRVPTLLPGGTYLIEVVIRAGHIGHHLTEGTADSNELWLEVTARSGDRVLGASGRMDEAGNVDPRAHFVNAFVIGRDGERIDRRNVHDMFTKLYDHQIPPDAAAVAHFRLDVPADLDHSVTIQASLRYRKFNMDLMAFVAGIEGWTQDSADGQSPTARWRTLPVTTLATDRVTFSIAGSAESADNQADARALWRRWNDYGIAMLLKGAPGRRQAEAAFNRVAAFGRYDGALNLSRLYLDEDRLDDAANQAYRASILGGDRAPTWTIAWLTGMVQWRRGYLTEAEVSLREAVFGQSSLARARGFDFSGDYVVLNALGRVLFEQSRVHRDERDSEGEQRYLREAAETFAATLAVNPENLEAHRHLNVIHRRLGNADRADRHARALSELRPDQEARRIALEAARQGYPAAQAARPITIYRLRP